MPQAKFQKFSEFSEFFRNLAPGVAPGYAAGLVKICIYPWAMPRAIVCTLFALRDVLCKFFTA
ncbi:hypothetical protein T4A_11579 [Trichinella pseudospiralis]|uniref:Uncharacterized protein n=1 Tax=Trichinella pseudospiralis TaxID=6337 RepID=A0A0V1BNK4_TRIPS|nr:hypothetical protein T4A_11579 [Trichinella pseudospiralis]